jgi:hypothetical protein
MQKNERIAIQGWQSSIFHFRLKKYAELSFILNILYFGTNFLSQVFKILHAFPHTSSGSAVSFIIKLVSITFEGSNEILELFKFLHCIEF